MFALMSKRILVLLCGKRRLEKVDMIYLASKAVEHLHDILLVRTRCRTANT